MTTYLRAFASLLCLLAISSAAQDNSSPKPDAELIYVVYLSRHGVRSPTGKSSQYNSYSTGAWPEWPVQPGLLTEHGSHLMELFGAYDHVLLAGQGLLQLGGCADTAHITIIADSDQRTRETGKALATGLMPGCHLPIRALPEGQNDPLFHALGDSSNHADPALAFAAVAGRIGRNPDNLAIAYMPQLTALDRVLSCAKAQPGKTPRISLFDIPAKLSEGSGDHLVDLKGPLNTASTLAENLLLEYTEGMARADVGWGCAGPSEIAAALSIHAAATDYTQRTPIIAYAQASTLLHGIALSVRQAVEGNPVAGALDSPKNQVLFLVGHDTNQENVAGALNLTWIIDGRRDDTPPGGALVFEVSRSRSLGSYSVRTFFTAQTLEQMRDSKPLTALQPPARVPVSIPGCTTKDMSCDLPDFIKLLER
jgi:4-phytase/acid phosphatase